MYVCFGFFFFKQKTAYEMRISDWSSDVCSSDLGAGMIQPPRAIQVLLVEDSEDDAALLLRELRRGGYDPQSRRAASADAFEDALESQAWDVILCDYTMPGFSGDRKSTRLNSSH